MYVPPNYYMTPEEFAEIIIDCLDEQNYFKRNEKAHPEDIVIAFTSQAESIAKGAGFVIKNIPRSA